MTSSSVNDGSSTSFGTADGGGAAEASVSGGGPSTELSSRLCNRVSGSDPGLWRGHGGTDTNRRGRPALVDSIKGCWLYLLEKEEVSF